MPASPNFALPRPSEAHVWLLRLGRHKLQAGQAVLSDDERLRAEQFRLEADRKRFVVTRAALRALLGSYLDEPAGALAFEYGPYGRPRLAGRRRVPELLFSVAHSGEFSMIALGRTLSLGVDIEDLAVERDVCRIADAILTQAERREWLQLPLADRKTALLQQWTRREAVGKALDVGLSMAPQALHQVLARPEGVRVTDLAPADGCVGAIAARTPNLKVCLTEFEPQSRSGLCTR